MSEQGEPIDHWLTVKFQDAKNFIQSTVRLTMLQNCCVTG